MGPNPRRGTPQRLAQQRRAEPGQGGGAAHVDGLETTTWRELQEVTGQGAGQARSNLGALSKQAIKAVGGREWPMQCIDLGSAVPSDYRYVYRMPAEVARWVLEVLA